METELVLVGASRTPIGRFGGSLSGLSAVELGIHAAKAALERASVPAEAVDQAVFGHARQAGNGPNTARQVALGAGLPVDRPAYTINQACLSGMQAILAAARAIRCGEAEVVLAGGMESMSRIPYLIDARWGLRMGHAPVLDSNVVDGYLDPMCDKLMGQTAETLARQYGISREEQDGYAARSQQRCEAARKEGHFNAEIAPIDAPQGRGTVHVDRDEHPRDGITAEKLAKLPAAFEKDGTVTAASSSGITDGAAAILVADARAAERLGLTPQARIRNWRVDAVAPEVMGIGPVPAVRGLLAEERMDLDEIDLVELNEAFAAQVIAVDRELGLNAARLNVNGGAIALGHPSGCTGARIVVTLIHEMMRRDVARGLATLCVSGGMGGALLIER